MTGLTVGTALEGFEDLNVAILSKPFGPVELLGALRQALTGEVNGRNNTPS